MKINILRLIDGAKAARGLTVIIDVFRAFSVEAYFAAAGAERIIPVGEKEKAIGLKKKYPEAYLCGERRGVKIEGFDFGNSPSEFENLRFDGKTIIHTTSAGTQGIVNAGGADEIITGSLVNASAIARYIKMREPEEVSLVAMGLDAAVPSEEDELAALYIKSLLENDPIKDVRERADRLRYSSGAKFFDDKQANIFPMRDFALCTDIDRFDFVLRLKKEKGSPDIMEKIDV